VFFQGHPEIRGRDTAARIPPRYRALPPARDRHVPPTPHGYFDPETVEALTALRERAMLDRREELLAGFPTAMAAGK